MPLGGRLNYNKADRQSLTARKSRNTRADPTLWFLKQSRLPLLTQYQLPLLWICLNLQQPKPNHSPTSCEAPNSIEPQAGAPSCLQAWAGAAFGDGSWTGVTSGMPRSIALSYLPVYRAPHSYELTICFLTFVRGSPHPCATENSQLACVLTGQLLICPFLCIWEFFFFFPLPPTHLHHPLHGATRAQRSEHWKKIRRKTEYGFYTLHIIVLPWKLILVPGLWQIQQSDMLETTQSCFKFFSQGGTQPNLTSPLANPPFRDRKSHDFLGKR